MYIIIMIITLLRRNLSVFPFSIFWLFSQSSNLLQIEYLHIIITHYPYTKYMLFGVVAFVYI